MGDPDGGGETCLVTLATRALPVLPTNGRTLQVLPGTGGGDGSAANPFKGSPRRRRPHDRATSCS
jgi:hypothetical protein